MISYIVQIISAWIPEGHEQAFEGKAKKLSNGNALDLKKDTHVRFSPAFDCKTLSFLCSKLSWENCGSSFTSILYLKINIVRHAIPSDSKNLI